MAAFDYSSSDDDDEQQCPLCIEDMDITDKHFKPCPCGFQICQFCYNSIRSGPEQYNRCPACRRPYDDASIEYKKFTQEDLKREQERKQRKEAERKQREREKLKDQHHHDLRDKKHLASMRVIQKNLVYVIGLNPNIPSDELQTMLRRDEFFGQYGKIQKIVVNKRVNGNGNPGVGVYVTFARKEDAARCIAAVDGSMNDGKYLRAAYGTTKYCSSYLRGQNCPNPNCMFLHEPGEEADSFNRHPNTSNTSHTAPHPTAAAAAAAAATPTGGGAASAANSPQVTPASLHNDHAPGHAGGTVGAAAAAQGATLTAANAPALPVWGKSTPQLPPVSKLTESDADVVSREAEAAINTSVSGFTATRWHFKFTSDLVDTSTKFPPMFSLPMDDKRRLKVFNKAIAELDKLGRQSSRGSSAAASVTESTESPASSTRQSRRGSPADSTPTKAGTKKHNGQHLLAHLMRSGPEGQPLDRQEEDVRSEPQKPAPAPAPAPAPLPTKQKLDVSAAHALLAKDDSVLNSRFAEALRKVGGELMQPAPPVKVDVDEDMEFPKGEYIDDGPHFDLRNIPKVELTGDVEPSVWAAIEDYTHLREQELVAEKAFSTAKAQTKKRVKKIRV